MGKNKEIKEAVSILVTGGAGFLGQCIVRELLDPASPLPVRRICVFDIAPAPDFGDERVEVRRADVRNFEEVAAACQGMDVVIHAAAIVDWGTKLPEEVYAVNYGGTEHVLQACREQGVGHLIFTSTLDVVLTGRSLVDIDETQPYPPDYPNAYCRSKSLAEQLILAADSSTLRTCALRPSDIYGEDDPYHLEALFNMAKTGFYVRIGDGSAQSQHVYVGNMAHAHVLAAMALLGGNSHIGGNAYFITDSPGENFFTFFDRIVFGAGYRVWPRNLWLPRRLAYSLGAAAEFGAMLLRPFRHFNPQLSRFAVNYTTNTFTFTAEKARRDFGFHPKYSQEVALERTVAHYKLGN